MLEGFSVFWIKTGGEDLEVDCCLFNKANSLDPMSDALKLMSTLRKDPSNEFVTMSSQNAMSVGKPGVDSIVDGKTPDGHEYTWSKAGRAGRMKKSDYDGSKVFVEK